MREFKIRVWDVKNKDWYYTVPGKPEDHNVLDTYYFENLYQNEEDYIWEQFTGLKDKNGREIYEGDIVKTTDRVTTKGLIFPVGVVEFKQQAFWICNVPSERPDFTHNETLLQYWETDLEVIGNIHENPELLGGK